MISSRLPLTYPHPRSLVLLILVTTLLMLALRQRRNLIPDMSNYVRQSPGDHHPPQEWGRMQAESHQRQDDSDKVEAVDFSNRDLYNLSDVEQAAFFRVMEARYAERRIRIREYCHTLKETEPLGYDLMRHYNENFMIYDARDRVAYCSIAKVGSSTWCLHFLHLANTTASKLKMYRSALQMLAPETWPLPTDVSETELTDTMSADDFTTIMFVRHPFNRVASVYYQKLVDLALTSWKHVTKHIIETYRTKSPGLAMRNESIARPDEFVKYLIDNFAQPEDMVLSMDVHFRSQHLFCPLCRLNFTVYGHLEEMNEDSAYFFLKSKLWNKVQDVHLHGNPSKSGGDNKEHKFWSVVGTEDVMRLASALKTDLKMFGYSIRDYFKALGLPEKVDVKTLEEMDLD